MIKHHASGSGFFKLRFIVAGSFCLCAIFLSALSSGAGSRNRTRGALINVPTSPGWSVVTSPNVGSNLWNFLTDVACVSASDCWALGMHRTSSNIDQTLAVHWDGSAWSIVSTPNPISNQIELYRVTCISTANCWATGSYDAGGGVYKTLIEHWDGNAWSIVPSPSVNGASNSLRGATCNSANDCWVVGDFGSGNFYGPNASYRTLIEHWDGNSWSIVPSANVGAINHLNDVRCLSASDCWAVGANGADSLTPLIEHWDGNRWSTVALPPLNSANRLGSIACSSSSQCWAVGFYYSGNPSINYVSSQTLIERWDGASWSPVLSGNPGTTYNSFSSVTCPSATDCWAVGRFANASGGDKTLIEYWDGNAWTQFPSPNPNPTLGFSGGLIGVACTNSTYCFSVGQYINNSAIVSQTFIEEYSPTIPPLTAVVSRMAHGNAGTFDVNLPLTGAPGIECRTSNGLGTGNYSVVFSLVNDVTSCGSSATAGATVVAGPNPNQCTVNLTGVADAQTINVELDDVTDAQNKPGNVSVPMGVLIGDANADGFVNVGDTVVVRNHSGENITSTNFREDLNADGLINVGDTAVVRSHSGDFLP